MPISYHSSTGYYGLHFGVGKKFKLDEKNNLDVYAKYFYTYQGASTVDRAGSYNRFGAIDSNRLQLGARYHFNKTNIRDYYVGLGYGYEFTGISKGGAYGVSLPAPSMKGSTGLIDVGMSLKPNEKSNMTIGIGLQGAFGKRQGVSGMFELKFYIYF